MTPALTGSSNIVVRMETNEPVKLTTFEKIAYVIVLAVIFAISFHGLADNDDLGWGTEAAPKDALAGYGLGFPGDARSSLALRLDGTPIAGVGNHRTGWWPLHVCWCSHFTQPLPPHHPLRLQLHRPMFLVQRSP